MRYVKRILWGTVMFWLSYGFRLLALTALAMLFRMFIKSESFPEFLWMSLVTYAIPVIVCILKTTLDTGEEKRLYVSHLAEGEWSVKDSFLYTIRNEQFLFTSLTVAAWGVFLPSSFAFTTNRLFFYSLGEASNFRLYFLPGLLTFALPFFFLYLFSLCFLQRKWAKGRLRHYDGSGNAPGGSSAETPE